MRTGEVVILGSFALGAAALILYPAYAPRRSGPYKSACLSCVKHVSIGLIIYQGDNDALPPRDEWIDVTMPYVKNVDVYHCPFSPKGTYGYAFNGALEGKDSDKMPTAASIPMVYDSVNPVRNASDLVKSLPAKPRHGRNTIGYADGHAKIK